MQSFRSFKLRGVSHSSMYTALYTPNSKKKMQILAIDGESGNEEQTVSQLGVSQTQVNPKLKHT